MKKDKLKNVQAFDIIKEGSQIKLVNISYDIEEGSAEIIEVMDLNSNFNYALIDINKVMAEKMLKLKRSRLSKANKDESEE